MFISSPSKSALYGGVLEVNLVDQSYCSPWHQLTQKGSDGKLLNDVRDCLHIVAR
jgi:hypothetical protein